MRSRSSFADFRPSFKGADTILLSLDEEAIRWLIGMFEAGHPFDIPGRGAIRALGGLHLAVALCEQPTDGGLTKVSEGNFMWKVSKDAARVHVEKLKAMLCSSEPCHQYLDPEQGGRYAVMASRGEY